MQIVLIDGMFTLPEAEELLSEIFKVKIRFHENRIQAIRDSMEDVDRSEKKIIALQDRLSNAIAKVRAEGKERISLYAEIDVSTAKGIGQ